MNKQELIAKIATDTGMSKTNAAAAVESFFEGITKSLKKGQPITFVGFGTFKTAQRKARTARNPQTGAAIKIPKRRVVRAIFGRARRTLPDARSPAPPPATTSAPINAVGWAGRNAEPRSPLGDRRSGSVAGA